VDPHGRFFAFWSRFYEATPILAPLLRRQQDLAIERLAARPGDRVLDLSCGPGRGLERLAASGARPVGLDFSDGMLDHAARRGPAVRGDALRLPFRDRAFAGLLCTNAFHHYPEPVHALAEMRRVLAPGGRAVLVDPSLDSWLARLTIYGGEALAFGMSVHLHAPADWLSMCRQAGFDGSTVEHIGSMGPMPRTSVLIVARRP